MMKKMKGYIAIIIFLLAALAGNGYSQKDPEKIKSEKIENFKYLFSEALKQKIFGNYRDAVKYFLECEKIKPDDAVEYQLSGLFAMAGDQKHAMIYGRKALNHDPGNIWYYYQLASIFQMYGIQDSLLSVYRMITEKFPDLKQDKMNYADLLVQAGQAEKAMEIYKELEKVTGLNKHLMQKEAIAYQAMGKKEKALDVINEAIGIFGGDKDLSLTQALILAENGEEAKAEEIYRKLMRKFPDDKEVEQKIYEYFIQQQKYGDALTILKKIVANEMIDPQQKIGYAFDISGKIHPSDSAGQKVMGEILHDIYMQYPGDVRTSLLLVDYYSRNEKYEKAKSILKEVIKKYPQYDIAWRQMLYLCDQLKDQDSVIYFGEKAKELFPKDPIYDVYLGYAWLQKGENQKALDAAQEGIRKVTRRGKDYVDKNTGVAYAEYLKQLYGLLGEIFKNLKEYKKSDQAFENGLKLDPHDDMLLNNYAYYLSLRKEKLKKALRMSAETVKRNPNNATYLDTYGWILFQMGKIKDAEKMIKKALDNGGDSSAEILMHYGDIMSEMGETNSAIEYWKRALQKGGKKEELEKRINSVRK